VRETCGGDPRAIRMQIERALSGERQNRLLGREARLIAFEAIAFDRVHRHYPVIRWPIEARAWFCDSKSAGVHSPWGFKSLLRHPLIQTNPADRPSRKEACLCGCGEDTDRHYQTVTNHAANIQP
jgi:hypothetical protein